MGSWPRWAPLLALAAMGCPDRVMTPQLLEGEPDAGPVDPGVDESCGPYATDTLMRCVSGARLESDVRRLAVERSPGSAGHAAARELCRARLDELGYEVRVEDYGGGVNVLGDKPGFTKPEERVIVGAHYDAVAGCPGADDNASGVAAALEAARVLATARFDRTLTVACWDEGELAQRGSIAHAGTLAPETVALAVSLEAVGYASEAKDSQAVPEGFEQLFPDSALALLDNDFRGDFLTVVAENASDAYAQGAPALGKKNALEVHVLTLTARQKVKQKKLHRSDHASFWDAGMPALLFTDTGPFRNPRIHCERGADDADSLDYGFAERALRVALGVVVEALELR
jgi:hypothetical protein